MQLFHRHGSVCTRIERSLAAHEQDIHRLITSNLSSTLSLQFLCSEYEIGGYRIDCLAIDQLGGPVIIEFKRDKRDGVINQALAYMACLKEDRSRFADLVSNVLGKEAPLVDWNLARIICIAAQFSDYDAKAITLLSANTDLICYTLFGDDLLGMQLHASHRLRSYTRSTRPKIPQLTIRERLGGADIATQQAFHQVSEFIKQDVSLGYMLYAQESLMVIQGGAEHHFTINARGRLMLAIWAFEAELIETLDPQWHPGIRACSSSKGRIQIPVYDKQSILLAQAALKACALLQERSGAWY